MNFRISNLVWPKRAARALPNWFRLVSAVACAAAPLASIAAPLDDFPFVYRNGTTEWSSSGDFNGDGLLDVVIVDRVSGAYRIGYQTASGEHTWVIRASGVAEVSGLAVGNLVAANAHALAFTAEAANRVNVVVATNTAQAGVPVPVFLPSVGPNQVVALDIGGAGNTALHDLIVPTAWNGVAPFRISTIRNTDGASFATLQELATTGRHDRGNRVMIKDATTPVLAIVERGATDTLRLVSYAGGPPNTFLLITNITGGSDYAVGSFSQSGLRHFLTYSPGRSNILSHAVHEPVAGTFEMAAPVAFSFSEGIDGLITLPGAANTRLLILFSQGAHGGVYDFDGTNAPVLIGELLPPPGETLTGATPLPNNGFRLHSGTGGRTTASHSYSYNPGTGSYSLDHSETLPQVSDLSGQANVFQFQAEPFVSPSPRLLNSGHAGDWSSSFSLAGAPPQVDAMAETFVDATHGLDNPAPASLGASHPLTAFGLANQYADAVSLFSLAPGIGDELVEVSALPAGGLYARSVGVRFVLGAPGFQVHYRFGQGGPWQTWSGNEIRVFTNSVLHYRARDLASGAQTTIRSEAYTFKQSPGDLDSDSDGVPDYVEIAQGIDPVLSGSDADDDGFSDLDELLEGTSPTNNLSQPLIQGYEQHAAVDLVLTPRPLDGTTGAAGAIGGGPHVRVFSGTDAQAGSAPVRPPPDSFAVVTNILVDPRRHLFVAATDPHFNILGLGKDRRIGRELVNVLPTPALVPIKVNYQYGGAGGVPASEAANWVLAAQAAYNTATNEVRYHDLTIQGTTVAVLLEHKLRSIVDQAASSNVNLTLFPFRPTDAGARQLDDEVLVLFEHGDPSRAAFDLRQMLQSLETMIDAPTAEITALNSVTHEIYRVSSVSNNDAPGRYRLPLDILREFVRHGAIDSNYLAAGTFPASLLADATAAVDFMMANLGSRLITNLTLRIRPDTFSGSCTTVETADAAATPVNLFALGGGAYDFPDTFNLIPGSVIYVVGRPDMVSTTCADLNVEVLNISLTAIPARSDGDTDGNLLIDSWELLFLGMLGSDPFGDIDGDGYSNLQEMFDGTDPRDRTGAPPGPVAMLNLPALTIDTPTGDGVTLAWQWPEAYMNKVQFQILSTTDLNIAPTVQPVQPVHQGGGIFTVTMPNPQTGSQFFKVILQIRP